MTDEIVLIKDGAEVVLTERRIRDLASKFLEACAKEANIHDDFGMNSKMLDMLMKMKQSFWPATVKNLNLQVQNFDDKMKKWMETRAEMNKAEKEGVKIIDIENVHN
ncbi:hypothetical protein KAI04_04850 [Candidatus Pacearchaeota archaeon]|nr:hypothetical protein [Candidatus Pacearchaeota archaeon]